jgi:hypothetical protein
MIFILFCLVLDEEATVVKEAVALHVRIGQGIAPSPYSSVSQQINALRQLLLKQFPIRRNHTQPDYFSDAAEGKIPIVIHTNDKDIIAAVVKLRNELRWENRRTGNRSEGAYIVIYGGADAHLVSNTND